MGDFEILAAKPIPAISAPIDWKKITIRECREPLIALSTLKDTRILVEPEYFQKEYPVPQKRCMYEKVLLRNLCLQHLNFQQDITSSFGMLGDLSQFNRRFSMSTVRLYENTFLLFQRRKSAFRHKPMLVYHPTIFSVHPHIIPVVRLILHLQMHRDAISLWERNLMNLPHHPVHDH